VNFTNGSTGASNYLWQFGDSIASTLSNPIHTYTNQDSTDTVFQVTMIAETTFGCRDTTSRIVTVFGAPDASFLFDPAPDCGPMDVPFTNTSTGAVSYQWDFGDTTGSTAFSPVHTYNNQSLFITNYNVSLIATSINGCTDTATDVVTVYPEPIFPFSTIPDSGCSPLSVTFPALVGAVVYDWDFGDGTTATGQQPTHTFINNTTNNLTYNVRLIATNSFGCQDTTYEDVVVFPTPTALFNIDTNAACSPEDILIANNSLSADSYLWVFGDGDSSTTQAPSFTHLYDNSGANAANYTLSLFASTLQGCSGQMDTTLTIYPEVHTSINPDTTGCHPLSMQWNAQGTGAVNYQWDFGDGTTSALQNPNHVYTNTSTFTDTTFTAILVSSNAFGCTDVDTTEVTVNPKPAAAFNLANSTGCTPLTVGINNLSTGASLYAWDFGNGQSSNLLQPSQHVFTNTQTGVDSLQTILVVTNPFGCMDTAEADVIVFPEVVANITPDTSGCHPFTVPFFNTSAGAVTYAWNFGNGNSSNLTTPTETFVNAAVGNQNYPVSMVATSAYGCADTAQSLITVHHKPTAGIGVSGTTGCSPFTVDFTNTSLAADTFLWNFGDGTSFISGTINQSHTYSTSATSPQAFNFNLIATTIYGCTDTATQTITVNPEVTAAFTSDSVGCSSFQVNFSNTSSGANNYVWDFGNGNISSQPNPDETFVYTGSTFQDFQVTLVATSNFGCSDSVTRTIRVYPEANVQFTATPALQTFPNTTVNLVNTTNGNWNWNWDFGDGNTSNVRDPGTHTYPGVGNYTITLEIDNGFCSDILTQLVVIQPPPPVADFVGSGEGCVPLTINFDNKSLNASQFLWDFGDGNTSSGTNPSYTYFQPGTYTVKLTAFGPNGNDQLIKVDSVVVRPKANAFFEAKPAVISVPGQAVLFLNLSSNATTWLWDFGDGNTSNLTQPEHFYQEPGEYFPTLIATNALNCADTFSLPFPIVAEAEGRVDFPNAFTPSSAGGSSGYYSPGRFNTDIFHPVITGVEQYRLTIYNRWGEMVFETRDQNQGWDGYYRGELCQQDAYVWKAEVTFVNDREETFVGDVTLIR
jgi:gliding motility-associated-like protein